MGTFKQDLKIGKKYEEIILERAKKDYPEAYIQAGKFKYWDVFIPEVNISLEVKYDERNQTSGNIAIECECNDKPSGITTTKADFWVLFDKPDGDDIWFLTEDIRKCIYRSNLHPSTIRGPGDPYEKKVYLIKKELLYAYQMPKNAWMGKVKQNNGRKANITWARHGAKNDLYSNKQISEFYD